MNTIAGPLSQGTMSQALGVPQMRFITPEVRQMLAKLGLTAEQIGKLTPEQALALLRNGAPAAAP